MEEIHFEIELPPNWSLCYRTKWFNEFMEWFYTCPAVIWLLANFELTTL